MNVWSSVGSLVVLGLHKIKDSLMIPGSALANSASFNLAPGFLVENKPMAAVAVLIEKVLEVETLDQFETAVIQSQLHSYHSQSVPSAVVPPFCNSVVKQGLSKLNMGMPVLVVGVLEDAPEPQKSEAKAVPAKEKSPTPPNFPNVDSLSPEARSDLDEIMDSFAKGKPALELIERGLGNPELAPVIQNVMSSPQVAPMLARMVSEMKGGN
jgi:hypothetical protein